MAINPYKIASKKHPKSLIHDLGEQINSFPKISFGIIKNNKVRNLLKFSLLFLCLNSLLYLTYNAFKYSSLPTSIDDIPLIKADIKPIKVSPESPGGIQILNQDKLIYSNLKGSTFKKDINIVEYEQEFVTDTTLRSPKIIKKPIAKIDIKSSDSIKVNKLAVTPTNLPASNKNIRKNVVTTNSTKQLNTSKLNNTNPFELLDNQ